jgi:hypothetical protein
MSSSLILFYLNNPVCTPQMPKIKSKFVQVCGKATGPTNVEVSVIKNLHFPNEEFNLDLYGEALKLMNSEKFFHLFYDNLSADRAL